MNLESRNVRRLICEKYPTDNLPRDLHPGLPPGRRVRVIIEDEVTDDELRREFHAEIQKSLIDIAAGRVFDVDEVLARIEARHGPAAAAAE